MITINREIRTALQRFIESCGSQLDAEKVTGIANTTFSKWMGPNSSRMQNSTWKIIFPYIKNHLPKEFFENTYSRQHLFALNDSTSSGKKNQENQEASCGTLTFSEDEIALLQLFRGLNPIERAEVIVYTKNIHMKRFKKDSENIQVS